MQASSSHHRSDWRPRPAARRAPASVPSPPAQLTARSTRCELDRSGRWLIVKNFVSEVERRELLGKALGHMQRGELFPNHAGPGRFFAKADDEPHVYVDALLQRMTRRCEACLRVAQVPADCVLGRTISLIQPGGFIHRHSDAYIPDCPGHRPGLEHFRCNIVVSLAHPSGRPIIEGETLEVEEGDLWAFFASRLMHETRTVQGSQPRIVFGFGWSVPPEYALQRPPESWDDR